MWSLHVFPAKALTSHPPQSSIHLSLLDAAPTDFDGSGVGVHDVAVPVRVNSAVRFSINATQHGPGYLFAKTDASGVLRYYALYASSTQLRLYYRSAVGGDTILFENSSIADGLPHQIDLVISQRDAALFIDSVHASTSMLRGPLIDCGRRAPNCAFRVGQRRGGITPAFNFTGTITSAEMVFDA
jgi:hypothetical protein